MKRALATFLLLSSLTLGAQVSFIQTPYAPQDAKWDPVRNVFFVSVPPLNRIYVINADGKSIARTYELNWPGMLAFSPDYSILYVGGGLGASAPFLTLIDPESGALLDKVKIPEKIYSGDLATQPLFPQPTYPYKIFPMRSGHVVMLGLGVSSGTELLEWSPTTKYFRRVRHQCFGADDAVMDADRLRLLVTCGSQSVIYSPGTDATISSLTHFGAFRKLEAHPRENIFAFSVGPIRFYDTNFNLLNTLNTPGINPSYMFSHEGEYLYSLGESSLDIFKSSEGTLIGSLPAINLLDSQLRLVTSSPEKIVALNSYGVAFIEKEVARSLNSMNAPRFAFPRPTQQTAVPVSGGTVTFQVVNASPNGRIRVGETVISTYSLASQFLTFSVPGGMTPGLKHVFYDDPNGWTIMAPDALVIGGPVLAEMSVDAGPGAGGNDLEILGYGWGDSDPTLSVSIGGSAAEILTMNRAGHSQYPFPLNSVKVRVPAGTGSADITLQTANGSRTYVGRYRYLPTRVFTKTGFFNHLLYDRFRGLVYASDGDTNKIAVLDPSAGAYLPDIDSGGDTPVGMALSRDGSELFVTHYADQKITVINLTTRTISRTYDATLTVGSHDPEALHPVNIALTANNSALVAHDSSHVLNFAYVTEFNFATGTQRLLPGQAGLLGTTAEPFLFANGDGSKVLIAGNGRRGGSLSAFGIWDATTNTISTRFLGLFGPDLTTTRDFARVVGSSRVGDESGKIHGNMTWFSTEVLASRARDSLQGQEIHQSGAFSYLPFREYLIVNDVNTGRLLFRSGWPEPMRTRFDSMAIDESGRFIFAIGQSGIVMQDLGILPLSIGSIAPTQGGLSGGYPVRVRGHGFSTGSTVKIGGETVQTSYVSPTELEFIAPSRIASKVSVGVQNPDGATYVLPLSFTYTDSVPRITAITPSTILVAQNPVIAVFGENFVPGSVIRLNGVARPTVFETDSQLTAQISTFGLPASAVEVQVANPDDVVSQAFTLRVTGVRLDPGVLDFGRGVVGGRSASRVVTVTNLRGEAINLLQPFATSNFKVVNGCASTLAAAQSCTMEVLFQPIAGGAALGELRVLTNDDELSLPLRGTGLEFSLRAGRPARSRRENTAATRESFVTSVEAVVSDPLTEAIFHCAVQDPQVTCSVSKVSANVAQVTVAPKGNRSQRLRMRNRLRSGTVVLTAVIDGTAKQLTIPFLLP